MCPAERFHGSGESAVGIAVKGQVEARLEFIDAGFPGLPCG